MAIVEIKHHPELTPRSVEQIFTNHFGRSGYWVEQPGFFQRIWPTPRHFAVFKTEWTAIGVRLRQKEGSTSFVFTALPPPAGSRSFLYNLAPPLAWLILRPGRKELESEVRLFIENAVDFQ